VYCAHLRTLEEYYDKPLAQQRGKWIDAQLHLKIFKDLNVIRALNENLLKDLQLNYDHDRSNKKPDETIGEIFLKFAPFLKTYTAYTNQFYNISEALRVLRLKNKELNEFLNNQSKDAGQTLESFLIMPVQRIPRYNLLLKELLKNTSQYHRDYETLVKALDAMKEIASYVNDKIKELESVNHMINIAGRMQKQLSKHALTKQLIVATRLFKFSVGGRQIAFVHSRRAKRWLPCAPNEKNSSGAEPHLIVFNDLLLVCNNPGFLEQEKEKEKFFDADSYAFPYEQLSLDYAIRLAPASLSLDGSASSSSKVDESSEKMRLPWMIELDNNNEHKHAFMLIAEHDILTLYFRSDDSKYEFMKTMAELLDGALKRDPSLKDHRALFLDYSDTSSDASAKTKSKMPCNITREHMPKFSSKKKLQEFKESITEEKLEKVKELEEKDCVGFCAASVNFADANPELWELNFHEGDVMAIVEKIKKGKKYWMVKKCGLNVSPARRNQLLENKLPETYKDMLTLMRYQQADKSREKWKKPAALRKIENHIIKVDKKTDKEIQELSEQLDMRSLLVTDDKPTSLSKKDRKSLSAASFNQIQFERAQQEDHLLTFLQQLTNVYAEKNEVGVIPQKYVVELPKLMDMKILQLLAKREEMEMKKRRNFMTSSEKRRLTTFIAPSPTGPSQENSPTKSLNR